MSLQPARFLSLSALFLIATLPITQAQTSQREIGLRFTDWDQFGLLYKKQIAENTYRRYRVALARFNYDNYETAEQFGMWLGFSIGKEKRKALNERLQWIHGWEPGLSLDINLETQKNDGYTLQSSLLSIHPYIGYVLGLQYRLNDHFLLGLENIPSLNAHVTFSNDESRRGFGLSGNFSFSNVALFVIYRFDSNNPSLTN